MKSFSCILVIVSMLIMSMDGIADSVVQGHAHGESVAHMTDEVAASISSESEDHCEQCCHGHTAGITTTAAPMTSPFVSANQTAACSIFVLNFAQAPPTPPPIV